MGTETHTRCPACNSSMRGAGADFQAPICRNCGLVLHEVDKSPVPEAEEAQGTDGAKSEAGVSGEDPIGWQSEVDIRDSSDQRIVKALVRLDTATEELNTGGEIRIQAAELVTDAWERRFMHGREGGTVIGACIYIACRKCGHPRPVKTVAESLDAGVSDIRSTYKELKAELEIKVRATTPEEYIPFLTEQLSLANSIAKDATQLLDEAQNIPGNPTGIAAAALYLAADADDESITYREAGQVAGVTKETVWRQATTIRNQ